MGEGVRACGVVGCGEERVGGGVGGWDPAREWVCVAPDVWDGVWFSDRR